MTPTPWSAIVLAIGYIGGFFVGSAVLRGILAYIGAYEGRPHKSFLKDEGTWIGLCEFFLIVTFVLASDYTAIGLVFAAKGIVRSEGMKAHASYYLLGTLLNVTLAVLTGLIVQWALLLNA